MAQVLCAALLFLLALPAAAFAQMDFTLDEVQEEEETAPAAPSGDGGDLIDQLASSGPAIENDERQVVDEVAEEIYAVQQIYALRLKRFELAPSAAFTLNDPFLSHPGIGVAANYWWTNVLAVGFNFLWYDFPQSTSGLVFDLQRSARLGVPITQWQMGMHANFTYVPFYGKFHLFNKFIFQWDSYVVGGVGFMRTKPIPRFDPEIREFSYGLRAAFNVGLGVRVFVTRYLAVFTEFRNYMFLERFENTEVDFQRRTDPATWTEDGSTFVNNATMQFGVTVFFPFKFEYRLPK